MLSVIQFHKYAFFEGLNEAELTYLAPHVSKRAYAKGVYLFYPNTPVLNTYLVETGLVRLFFTNSIGQEFLLNLVRPGEVFGLPLLQDDQLRIIGAATYQPSTVLSISRDHLLQMMDNSPEFAKNLYQELSISARKLLLHSRTLATSDLVGRLATMLLRLSEKSENQNMIDMPLTQSELAGWVGASRGRLNRTMNHLQDCGMIRIEDQRVIILDRSGLEKLTEEQTEEKV